MKKKKRGGFFLHISKSESVPCADVVGVFDMESATVSRDTVGYMKEMQKGMRTVSLCDDLPASFVVCDGEYAETLYLTQLSAHTIAKRAGKNTETE